MEFIDHHCGNGVEKRVRKQAPQEHPLGQEADPSLGSSHVLESELIADGTADLLAEFLGNAAGGHLRRNPSRLEHENLAVFPELRLQERAGHAGGLAGARRRFQNERGPLLKSRQHVGKNRI